MLPPTTNPRFCSSSGICEACNARFPLLTIPAHLFLPDPLRIDASPAAQLRPKSRP